MCKICFYLSEVNNVSLLSLILEVNTLIIRISLQTMFHILQKYIALMYTVQGES